MLFQEIQSGFQNLWGEWIVRLPVKIMDITGCNEGLWVIAVCKFTELVKGYICIVCSVSCKQRTGQGITGTEGVVQIKEFFRPSALR